MKCRLNKFSAVGSVSLAILRNGTNDFTLSGDVLGETQQSPQSSRLTKTSRTSCQGISRNESEFLSRESRTSRTTRQLVDGLSTECPPEDHSRIAQGSAATRQLPTTEQCCSPLKALPLKAEELWPKTPRFDEEGLGVGIKNVRITQKLDGCNAQVHVFFMENGQLDLRVGSRTVWLDPGTRDLHGLREYVNEHKADFLGLGVGRHFGEWVPKNGRERLKESMFFLFDRKWKEESLPKSIGVVPELYSGEITRAKLISLLEELKEDLQNGGSRVKHLQSKRSDNPLRRQLPETRQDQKQSQVEGMVLEIDGQRSKIRFDNESSPVVQNQRTLKLCQRFRHFLQPRRVEKRIEAMGFREGSTNNQDNIVVDYIDDLISEMEQLKKYREPSAAKDRFVAQLSRAVREFVDLCVGEIDRCGTVDALVDKDDTSLCRDVCAE